MSLLSSENNPFCQSKYLRSTDIHSIIQQFCHFDKEELVKKNVVVNIAGRISAIRDLGNLIFPVISDQQSNIQLLLQNSKTDVNLRAIFNSFKKVNLGDILGIKGTVCKTNSDELTVKVNEFTILSRCLKTIPSTYYGLEDKEERFRKRYLDLIVNQSSRQTLIQRFQIINAIRKYLNQQGFIEVETPILVAEASGAQAKPFVTYHNKLKKNFYLRIATEIPLKKLLIGGFEKIYEIGRIFRNEGIDARHNPEFTTIEIYAAYEDAEKMMEVTEKLLNFVTQQLRFPKEIKFASHTINFTEPFRRISMLEAIEELCQVDFSKINSFQQACQVAQERNLKLENYQNTVGHIIYAFFEKYVEKKLIQPTFVYDFPLELSPLAKTSPRSSRFADRFELYIAGLEFANGYSELNDPVEQKKRFEEQAKQKDLGNEEIANYDHDFVESLEYGMPPAGGLGIGIDRLTMLFTNQNSIKEVIAFPQLKEKK